mgnify:CR=1 FL=1
MIKDLPGVRVNIFGSLLEFTSFYGVPICGDSLAKTSFRLIASGLALHSRTGYADNQIENKAQGTRVGPEADLSKTQAAKH